MSRCLVACPVSCLSLPSEAPSASLSVFRIQRRVRAHPRRAGPIGARPCSPAKPLSPDRFPPCVSLLHAGRPRTPSARPYGTQPGGRTARVPRRGRALRGCRSRSGIERRDRPAGPVRRSYRLRRGPRLPAATAGPGPPALAELAPPCRPRTVQADTAREPGPGTNGQARQPRAACGRRSPPRVVPALHSAAGGRQRSRALGPGGPQVLDFGPGRLAPAPPVRSALPLGPLRSLAHKEAGPGSASEPLPYRRWTR